MKKILLHSLEFLSAIILVVSIHCTTVRAELIYEPDTHRDDVSSKLYDLHDESLVDVLPRGTKAKRYPILALRSSLPVRENISESFDDYIAGLRSGDGCRLTIESLERRERKR